MEIDGAVVTEQGVTFAIVVVDYRIIDDHEGAQREQRCYAGYFDGMPIILMGLDRKNVPRYFGRDDIVRYLASIDPNRIPWRRFTVGSCA